MKILYLADVRFPLDRATGVHVMETCAALAARGHAVHLLVRPDTESPQRDPLAFYGVPPTTGLRIERVPSYGVPPVRRARYLAEMSRRILQRNLWDVVCTAELILASTALRLPAPLRPPVVYESHNFRPAFAAEMPELVTGIRAARTLKLRRLWRREQRVWQRADGYITITQFLADELRNRFGPRKRTLTLPCGVRIDAWRRYEPRPRHAGPPVVAYAGHFYPYNGVHHLVRALTFLPDVHALIIGGNPRDAADVNRIRQLVLECGLDDRVTFTGLLPPSDVVPRLRDADVLVQPIVDAPYTRYASSMKLLDYMTAGRPIVASDLMSLREVVSDGITARLVEPGNPRALAEGIREVLVDPDGSARMAQAALEAVMQYSWVRRAERLEGLLDEVL